MAVPDDPDTRLTRYAAAAALSEAGFPVSPATLATKATRGGGPPFQKFGPRPLYRWGDAIQWARTKLGPVVTSTSQLDPIRAGQITTHCNRTPRVDREETPGADKSDSVNDTGRP